MQKIFKKLFGIALILFVSTSIPKTKADTKIAEAAEPGTKALYLQINDNWKIDNARFALYAFDEGDQIRTWFNLDAVPEQEKLYTLDLPLDPYRTIIFLRMNPSVVENRWNTSEESDPGYTGQKPVWNQTTNIAFDPTNENNLYVINDGAWGESGSGDPIGYWTKYLPTDIIPDPDADIQPSIYTIHYWRNDNRQANYDLWLWSEGQSGQAYPFLSTKTIGTRAWRVLEVSSQFFKHPRWLDIIVRLGDWQEQTPDMRVDVTEYPLYEDALGNPRRDFFLVDMETTVYQTVDEAVGPKILDARFTSPTEVTIATYHEPASYAFKIDGVVSKTGNVSTNEVNYRHTFKFNVDNNVNVTYKYEVDVTFVEGETTKTRLVTLEGIYNHEFFINNFTYEGSDLGVTYTPQQTTFKVWAPTSSDVKINLYENGTPESVDEEMGSDVIKETLPMTRGEKGTWVVTKTGDLHGTYYTLVATNANGTVELTDPYAKAAGVNGVRGMIVDFSKTNPTGWSDITLSELKPTEIIPYELHVSDLTADDTWNGKEEYRKNFLGLTQRGTMYQQGGQAVKTGFDHILELGVNAVQILPFYDQQNDETDMSFNWGYNPQNYNVLEGGYSSDPHNGLVRINEFKQVVKTYADHDIRIIMDVVYNHVASISQHSFSKLVPGYYFRYKADGAPDNSSGVGNVTASERIMMERFMRDSTEFWAKEYKIAGFRFDLMGLHTVKAMNTLANNLKTIDSDIVIYGEPWQMDAMGVPELATQSNIYKMQHVGAFNDAGRDAIKGGSWSNEARTGWVQNNGHEVDKVIDATMGKISGGTTNPSQVLNYISVHDNYTIYDHLQTANRIHKLGYGTEALKAQALQAEAISFLGQGIGFMHAGSEILRSKPVEGGGDNFFDHNSYKSSYAVNAIKWDEKWNNLDYYNAYRQMVALKRYSPAFNYATRTEVDTNSSAQIVASNLIKLTYVHSNDEYTIYHHGASTSGRATINDLQGKEVVLDTSGVNARGTILTNRVNLDANTSLIVRNVRDRGSNDLTWPSIVEYVGYVDPIDPTDPVDPGSSIPPTSSLPDGNSGDNNGGLSTPVIVGLSVGGAGGVGGIVLLVIKLLRKKP